ncbi:MAG: STAS domain-containing protein [Planctomycetota bacterium]
MEITKRQHGAVTIIRPDGPLVAEDAERFAREATDAASEAIGRLVVDATSVGYLDSAGLEALLALSDSLETAGRALSMCGVVDTVREAMELTGVAARCEFFDDAGSAARSFL